MSKYSELKTKKAKQAYIRELVATNAKAAVRALVRIYELQTEDEKAAGFTRVYNNIGFSGVDGEILSSFAEQVNKGRTLSPKQMAIVFKKMPRYSRQLMEIADAS